jgi:hypothetical protein
MRVQFETVVYECSHGTRPRGTGSWAFCAYDKYRRDDYLDFVFWHSGAYGEAKSAARKHFAAAGVSDVVVCP